MIHRQSKASTALDQAVDDAGNNSHSKTFRLGNIAQKQS